MTRRTFNYTKRVKVPRDEVGLATKQGTAGVLEWSLDAPLSDPRFAPHWRVYLEAYYQAGMQRFDLGTVGHRILPEDRALGEFLPDQPVSFRLKVVDPGVDATIPGRIAAIADALSPALEGDSPGRRVSLLDTAQGDLGEAAWDITFDARPVLVISNRISRWKEFARSPQFAWLAYPEVVRRVLTHVIYVLDIRESGEGDTWEEHWLRYGALMAGRSLEEALQEDESASDDWITEAVTGFAATLQLWRQFGRRLAGNEEGDR